MNKELIMSTLNQIEGNLTRWNQDSFSEVSTCGTTACFAGWAMIQSGYHVDEDGIFYDRQNFLVHGAELELQARILLEMPFEVAEKIFYWFPEDHVPEWPEASRGREFEVFRPHVLAVTGLADES